MPNPIIFVNYARFDDDANHSFMQEFTRRLRDEIRGLKGVYALDSFIDRKDLRWGQMWKQQVDDGLGKSAFLLSFISPSFLQSEECRREFMQFRTIEEQRHRSDLILPVYFIRVPELPPQKGTTPRDEITQVVAGRQYIDWRDLRTHEWSSSAVRTNLAAAAQQLLEAIENVTPDSPATTTSAEQWVVSKERPGYHTSISETIARAQAGAEIRVESGHYDETIRIAKPVALVADTSRGPVIVRSGAAPAITVEATSGFVSGFAVECEKRGDAVIRMAGVKLALHGCIVDSPGVAAVRLEDQAELEMSDCQTRNTDYGIWMPGPSKAKLRKCDLRRHANAGLVCGPGAEPDVEDCVITECQNAAWLYAGAKGRFGSNDLRGNRSGPWNLERKASVATIGIGGLG
jgi:hypothetical protein